MRPFHPYRHELITDDGLVWKGHKVIIPETLQLEYMQIVHRGHPGAESTKQRARGIFFWPTMTKDIDAYITSCATCNHRRINHMGNWASAQGHHVQGGTTQKNKTNKKSAVNQAMYSQTSI